MSHYTLHLSGAELERYRSMAEAAMALEMSAWSSAGIASGARVVDAGCGPGFFLAEIAGRIEPGGFVVGVDRDLKACSFAEQSVRDKKIVNAYVCHAEAAATPLRHGFFDTVMMRHVLLHNGLRIREVVSHLTTLLRPGGHLFFVETDCRSWRDVPSDEDLLDLQERWFELLRRKGNDLEVGPKLGHILLEAGLELVALSARYDMFTPNPGVRGARWAARQSLLEEGLASPEDVERWDAAYSRYHGLPGLKVTFGPMFLAVGRKS